jgi:transmembrane sensor
VSRAKQIEELASLWVIRREEPSWSHADQAELDEWLAQSDANKVAYWRLEHGWREADRIASLGVPLRTTSHGIAALPWKPLALAASLLLAFTIFLLQGPGLPVRGTIEPAVTRFETPVGGHRLVSLADGSRVELNTATVIKADVTDQHRAVWLEHGEAFFSVAKQQGRRFVIYAGPRTITVLGTKFSVRRSDQETVVAVLEGRVQVEATPTAGPRRQATVTTGEVAIASDRDTLVAKSPAAVQQQLAWRNGVLDLDGLTLAAAAEQFNRYNQTQLVIGDADAGRTIVGGSFVARNVEAFARLLSEGYGLDARDSAGKITISTRRMASNRSLTDLSRSKNAAPITTPDCGSGHASCAVIPLSPPAPQTQVAMLPDKKAIRDANNWDVLHKLYPPRALAAGEEGLVGFVVEIDSSGSPTKCKITHTSGHALLDLETCQLIMMHATFSRPAGISPSQKRSYEGVVNWKLPTTPPTAVPAAPKVIAESKAPEPLICKKVPKTGSLAGFERKCMSQSDWQKASSGPQQVWEELQGIGSSCDRPLCQ